MDRRRVHNTWTFPTDSNHRPVKEYENIRDISDNEGILLTLLLCLSIHAYQNITNKLREISFKVTRLAKRKLGEGA